MKIFLIQSKVSKYGLVPLHDFGFSLIQAIDWHKWYYGKSSSYDFVLSESINQPIMDNGIQYYSLDNVVPIGSVEFVHGYLKKYYNIDELRPVNIPKELMKTEYLKRWVRIHISDKTTFNCGNGPIFVKDNSKIKGFTSIVDPNQGYDPGEYLISELIEIESEWRCFVFQGKLVGIQNYMGDFTMLPDIRLIKEMIKDYDNNQVYTLDVGINENGTFILEIHKFYSVGLYGFSDYKLLPLMFSRGWNEILNLNLKY